VRFTHTAILSGPGRRTKTWRRLRVGRRSFWILWRVSLRKTPVRHDRLWFSDETHVFHEWPPREWA
jgi:hypothetical protein